MLVAEQLRTNDQTESLLTFSDRFFFAVMRKAICRGVRSDRKLQTRFDCEYYALDFQNWATHVQRLLPYADAPTVSMLWLHALALDWWHGGTSNPSLKSLSDFAQNMYFERFGAILPEGWCVLVQMFGGSLHHGFSETIPMPVHFELYVKTHKILVQSRYFTNLEGADEFLLQGLQSNFEEAKECDFLENDLWLEIALILRVYGRLHSSKCNMILRHIRSTNLEAELNDASTREQFHFRLLQTLFTHCDY